MITTLHIENFKSLKSVHMSLGPTNFIVGPNASGKSNLAEALDFLSHAARENLAFAVAEKGGFYNICHRRQRRARGGIAFEVAGTTQPYKGIHCHFTLKFEIRTRGQGIRSDFYVASESLSMRLDRSDVEGAVTIGILRDGNKYSLSLPDADKIRRVIKINSLTHRVELLSRFLDDTSANASPQQLFLTGLFRDYWPFTMVTKELEGLRVFQLNPRLARQPAAPSVNGELGRRGENLSAALDRMRNHDKKNFSKLSSWLKDVVPSLNRILTDYTDSRQLGLFFEEEGFASRWYAEDMSDGTIMSVALFFALLDPRHRIVVIEEPETSLHPWILRKFLERCNERADQFQVIITTHSPLAVAQAKPHELFLIDRHNGATIVKRATDIETELAKIIRSDLIDLGQYWMSGGLGAVPTVPDIYQGELFGDSIEGESE